MPDQPREMALSGQASTEWLGVSSVNKGTPESAFMTLWFILSVSRAFMGKFVSVVLFLS